MALFTGPLSVILCGPLWAVPSTLQATFDKVLTEGTESIQNELTSKFTENKAALDKKIAKLTQDYFDEMEKVEKRIFEMKSDKMRSMQLAMLYERIEEFVRTANDLMRKYEEAHKISVVKKI